ncbi:conserved uncharacterized protein [Candidatus Vecturithrix granuli]|uniref:Conserved uncharacterized protein n=1 Tax=Vecturithrix granuli TaxID=1499967 RepID=A0A081C9E7_VECG1|nr:conserved uncharacterized protein [Candidatus Vecturithrix granuli]
MKRIVYIGILVILLQGSRVVMAQTPAIASASIRIDLSEVNALWFEMLNYIENQDWIEANLKLLDLNQKKNQMGFSNLSVHSTILIQKAQQLKKQGQSDQAMKLLEAARLLSPDFPDVYFATARFLFAQNFTDVYKIGREIWRGLLLKYSDIFTLLTYTNNSLAIFLFAGMLTSVIFVIFSFVYYRRAIFYQMKAVFPFELPVFIGHIIGWGLLALVTIGMGIWGGLLFLMLLLVWHIDLGAKRVLRVILFFGGMLAGLLLLVCTTFYAFNGEYVQALRNISRGEYTSRTVTVLQKYLQDHPDDPYSLFGLAYIAQKTGNVQVAVDAYEKIASDYPDQAVVQNNLGNIYQQQYRSTKQQAWYQKAGQAYQNAVYYAPKKFEIRYNFGQFLLLEFQNSEKAHQELQLARDIDQYRFTMYSDHLRGGGTIDIPFTTLTLLKKLYTPDFFAAATALSEQVWASGSRFKNAWYFSIACGVLFVLTFVFGAKKGAPKHGIFYCQMCGDPYIVKQKKSQDPQTFCTQCTYIFKKKTVVKPEKREAKVKQIQLRQKGRGLFAKVSSFCFPGTGQIYYGYPTKGTLFAFLFSIAGSVFLLKGFWRVLVDAEKGPELSWTTIGIFLLLLMICYVFNIYDVLKLSPKNQ